MNLYHYFQEKLGLILEGLAHDHLITLPVEGVRFDGLTVEPPRDASHGDMATNAALVLAKPLRMAPNALAALIAPKLEALPEIRAVTVAGPGFINWRLVDAVWQKQIPTILAAGKDYGQSMMGQKALVNIEYVSANPTGPMHVGHVRGAVFGDALARLLTKAGFLVTKEYYINDAGGQIDVLARSVHLRYREALGQQIEIAEGLYPGEYLIPVGRALAAEHGDRFMQASEDEWLPIFKEFSVAAMMDLIRGDLKVLGVEHDVFFSERALHKSGRIAETVEVLRARGHIYEGILEAPKGKAPEDWEPRKQTLFRATAFGDDVDRALQKSNGDYTYFAADIAYHLDKYRRGFHQMINVWGADHGGYVKRIEAAIKALADDATLDVKICQMVKLLRAGEPVKMSKRSGNFITLRDVVEEVGRDVTRFIMLTRKNDASLDFDYEKVMEQSKDNPVFYVQYAHARICSVLRKAKESMDMNISDEALGLASVSLLGHEAELGLVKKMASWPRFVESAAEAHEPHRIAFFLYELASEFHSLWNRGNDEIDLRFLQDKDEKISQARMAMIRATALVLASGLAILGVAPLEEM